MKSLSRAAVMLLSALIINRSELITCLICMETYSSGLNRKLKSLLEQKSTHIFIIFSCPFLECEPNSIFQLINYTIFPFKKKKIYIYVYIRFSHVSHAPVHEGFYYKTTTAHRSVRGNEHLDFTTYITTSAEPPPLQA